VTEKLETDVQTPFLKWAEAQEWIWITKYPGGIYGKKGTPDTLMSIKGLFLAIELKRPNAKKRGSQEKLQEYERQKIRKSGGICEKADTLAYAMYLCLMMKAAAERIEESIGFTVAEVVEKAKTGVS